MCVYIPSAALGFRHWMKEGMGSGAVPKFNDKEKGFVILNL